MIAYVSQQDSAAFDLNAAEELADSLHEGLKRDEATLLEIVVVEHVHNDGSRNRNILSLAHHIELVNDVLVNE